MHTSTVLILDRDLGFVCWLGRVVTDAGYQALPATSCEDGTELIRQLNLDIDLLIVSSSVPGAGGFVHALRHSQGYLQVIAVLDDADEPVSAFSGADAARHRHRLVDEGSETEWVDTIQGVFAFGGATTRIRPSRAANS